MISLDRPLSLSANAKTDPAKIEDAARQLEGQFAQMLIKSMRQASFGDSLFPGQMTHYRDMQDQQFAKAMTEGRGLGLAPMIAKQMAQQAGVSLPSSSQDAGMAAAKARMAQASTMYSLSNYSRPMPAKVDPMIELAAPNASSRAGWISTPAPVATLSPRPVEHASDAAVDENYANIDAKPGTPEAFVAQVWPHAKRAAAELGVCPKALVAQAALETGWGRSTIGNGQRDANNYFGIKAGRSWQGDVVSTGTKEFINGAMRSERAAFRAYASPAESFADYVALLKNNPRYANALQAGENRIEFAKALQQAGYATDPQYAAKINAIATGPTLNRAIAALDNGVLRG